MDADQLKSALETAGIGNSEPGAIQLLCSLAAEGIEKHGPAAIEHVAEYVHGEAAMQRIGFLQALEADALKAVVAVAVSALTAAPAAPQPPAATEPPTTEPPTTEAPTTEAPTTEPPTTAAGEEV